MEDNRVYKVSVIVPVYKVETFIGRCAESLFSQTLADVEYIFVDDASPDGSMEVLEKVLVRHPDRKPHVRILRHECNKGLPAARNTGLVQASGEYIFHCDSDDYVEPDMLEVMYGAAADAGADIVWSDWYLTFSKNERYMPQPDYDTPEAALKGMLGGAMKYNVWNKLTRRSLYTDNAISFPSGYAMGEDMTMLLLFACASKVCHVPGAYYHYVKMNTGALTGSSSSEKYDALRHNVRMVENFLHERCGDRYDMELAFLKLEAKYPLLVAGAGRSRYRMWKEWYPEANRYIMKNRNVSLRSRLLQWCAAKGQFWIVRLHYILICRLVYGVIYR